MKTYLPQDPPFERVREILYKEPLAFWVPTLEVIRERHGLSAGTWERFGMGRNAVFSLGEQWVVKVMPPQWEDEAKREMAALDLVANQVPFLTPELAYSGDINGWAYLITVRLEGRELNTLWPKFDRVQKAEIAHHMGEATACFHGIALSESVRQSLEVDWVTWLSDQKTHCFDTLKTAGISPMLLDDLSHFFQTVGPLPVLQSPDVFLHGDMNIVNVMMRKEGNVWQFGGVFDFGDAKIGQAAHDFISPGIHVFKGHVDLLHAFYEGYGLSKADCTREFQHHVMARTILWYAGEYLKKRLDQIPQTGPRDTWEQVAEQYWHMVV